MRLAQQLLAGLAHAHAQGIVHRDLKPENLILSEEAGLKEHLRILDFGLAKLRDGPAMTAGMAVGTPSYMSPEQSGAEGAIDARTDLYTVGVVLFEMFTGRKPFQSENVGEVILMQREAPPPKLRATAPEASYSVELEALIDKAMSKLPEDRFQSAAELAAALAATPEGKAAGQDVELAKPAPRRPTRSPRQRRRPRRPKDRGRRARQARGAGDGAPGRQDDRRHRVGGPAAAGSGAGASPPVRQFRLAWIGALFVVVALLALLLGRGLAAPRRRRRHGAGAAAHPAPGASAPCRRRGRGRGRRAAESPQLEQARQMVARGEIEPAIALLNQLRAQEPDNADAPYLLAMIDFDNRRWPDGLAAAQIAVRKNPALKADPDLIKGAIRSLVSDRGYDRSQAFLRSLGPPATPFIKEAAARDASPKVRERAAELLGSSGRGWGSRVVLGQRLSPLAPRRGMRRVVANTRALASASWRCWWDDAADVGKSANQR